MDDVGRADVLIMPYLQRREVAEFDLNEAGLVQTSLRLTSQRASPVVL